MGRHRAAQTRPTGRSNSRRMALTKEHVIQSPVECHGHTCQERDLDGQRGGDHGGEAVGRKGAGGGDEGGNAGSRGGDEGVL